MACTKSCAVWPSLRSGGVSPKAARIGPVEKSIGARLRRPHRLVEAAKQDDIGFDEARFEKPEDLEARMRGLRRRAR